MPELPDLPDDVALRAWRLLHQEAGVAPDAGSIADGGVRVHLGGPTIGAVIRSVHRAVTTALSETTDQVPQPPEAQPDDDALADGALDDVEGKPRSEMEWARYHLGGADALIEMGHDPDAENPEAAKLSAQSAALYAVSRARVHAELAVVDALDALDVLGLRLVDAIERAGKVPHVDLRVEQ